MTERNNTITPSSTFNTERLTIMISESDFLAKYIPEPEYPINQTARGGAGIRKEKTKAYDRARHALQNPISQTKLCVIYTRNGKERRSPWFYNLDRAQTALLMLRGKYGHRNAVLLRD